MVSKDKKKEAALHDKLQLLRSITKSQSMNESAIVVDASHYIKELKHKVECLNEDIASSESSSNNQNVWPEITVETLEKGFSINVHSRGICPGLLEFILDTFEELGLNIVEARVSCAENFHLQALGELNEEDEENIDSKIVKRAISNAIKNWSES